jgi:transglutaminase-like putative cysteine protease
MAERRRVVVIVAGLAAVLAAVLGVWRPWSAGGPGPATRRTVSFRGEAVATVDERIMDPPGPVAQRVVRDTELGAGGRSRLEVDLDERGLARAARYDRPGQRVVELRPDGDVVVDGRVRQRLTPPILVIDVLHRVRTTSPLAVTLFEPSSAEALSARLVREGPNLVVRTVDGDVLARALPEGPRHGPGAFAEGDVAPERPWAPVEVPVPGRTSVAGMRFSAGPPPPAADDPVGDDDQRPGAFVESDDDGVVAFARPLCAADALDTARRLGEAIRPRVDASARAPAPGARQMLAAGGDCDGAAALAVAALRACGHPARVVVGYVLVEPGPGARLVPHAVAEVYRRDHAGTSGRWWRLDPTVPSLTDNDDRFVPVATGLGGALSMGRVLGLVDEGDLVPRGGTDARP